MLFSVYSDSMGNDFIIKLPAFTSAIAVFCKRKNRFFPLQTARISVVP